MDLNRYNIQGSQDAAQALAANNIRWITLRWYYVLLLATISIAAAVLSTWSLDRVALYVGITLGGYALNFGLLLLARRGKDSLQIQRTVLAGQLLLDLLLCAVVTLVQGGIEARTTVLYAIPIVASGLAFMRQLVIPVAAASGIVYVTTILLPPLLSAQPIEWADYGAPVVFYPLLFLVLGRVVEFLTTVEANDVRERTYNSFLSLLAHQLKHPASASKTIIDVMEHDDTAHHTEQTQHYLQLLRGESENQIRLIDNLLEAAPRRQPEIHTEAINLVVMVEKTARQTARAHQRTEDLVRDQGAGGPVVVWANPIKLQLALTNIFDNSFRHTADGVAVHYGIRLGDGIAQVTVSDEGAGMNKDHLRAVKRRFSGGAMRRIDSGHDGGLGLGLFTANKVVAAHGGTLTIQSREHHGTTVILRIKGARQ